MLMGNIGFMPAKDAIQMAGSAFAKNESAAQQASLSDANLRKCCEAFEAMLMEQVFRASRKTLNPENRLVNGGQSEEIFRDMLDQEYSRSLSQTQNIGLAESLYKQWTTGTTTAP